MSINRPKRIFRSGRRAGAPAGTLRAALMAVAACAVLGGGVAVATRTARLLRAGTAEPGVITAAPEQVAVVNGDTLRLGSTVVRLSDVKAPRRGAACAAGPDCGGLASSALAALVRNRKVECRVQGHDGWGRPAAQCEAGGRDVNVALVAMGWAQTAGPEYSAAESEARAQRRGMWLSD